MIIKNARLVNYLTEGYDNQFADVVIAGNIITDILPVNTAKAEEDDILLDAKGKTLLPGLWDIHAHLYFTSLTCNYDVLSRNIGDEIFSNYDFAMEYLKQGFTTIRDCGATRSSAIYLRNIINKGYLKGPRIIACGTMITPTSLGNETWPLIYTEVDSPDEARKAARVELAQGADFLKFMATGSFSGKGSVPGKRICTVEELKAIQEVAELDGTYAAVHCHGSEAIDRCVEVGIHTIEHGSLITDETIDKLVENQTSFIIPTLSLWAIMVMGANGGMISDAVENKMKLVHQSFACWEKANKAGLKLGFGTDITMPEFIENPGLEFTARYEYCQMSNKDILLQATKNSAEILGYSDTLGTIKEGKIADIILVDGNPDEDIYVMKKPAINVIRNGEIII